MTRKTSLLSKTLAVLFFVPWAIYFLVVIIGIGHVADYLQHRKYEQAYAQLKGRPG